MPGKTISVTEMIANGVSKIFDQSQNTTANHQKNRVALHKLHKEAAEHVESVQNGKGIKLVGERAFESTFIEMVNHILQVKKGVAVADRAVKFIGGYVMFLNDKVAQEKTDEDEDEDDMASRFVARLLKHLIKGFMAKDKNIRYRVLQMVSELISHLGEIEDEVYAVLRACLLDRTKDKESSVRVQAAIALSKLAGSEDPDDLEENEMEAIEVLMDMLQYDISADVRRAILLNIPLTERTWPAVLSRTRDTDDVIRKMVYSHVLSQIESPKSLKIVQRELIVRNGLGDRQAPVRAAAGKLIGTWVDIFDGDLIKFLTLFDLIETEVAEDALLSVFVTRPDIFDNVEFNEEFWNELTPESAFLVRVFVEHCINTKDEARLESSLPVVTALAFKIQAAYNDLIEQIQVYEEARLGEDFTEEDQDANDEARANQEFVIEEMLRLAVNLDYADEIGRRKMFGLVRDMISQDCIPEKLMARCLDVLRVLSPNERDLIRLIVEIVHEIRDEAIPEREEEMVDDDGATEMGDTPRPSRRTAPPKELSEEEQARMVALNIRCLDLCIGVLERVNGTYEENSSLMGILNEFVLPSIHQKHLELREKGLVCLGLCCLISKRMAGDAFSLFMNQIKKKATEKTLRVRLLKAVCDILMVHETEFLGRPGERHEKILQTFGKILWDNEDGDDDDGVEDPSDELKAVACVGVCKLMLSGMMTDERILIALVLSYMSPYTKDNQELRQCLSYFFPVYCFSSSANQRRLQKVALTAYAILSEIHSDLEDGLEMIPPSQIALLLADWTDPRNIMEMVNQDVDELVHVDLALDIAKLTLKQEIGKDDRKVLCQTLSKLYFPDTADMVKIQSLKLLLNKVQQLRQDASTKNALARLQKSIEKQFTEQLEGFDEEELRKLEELHDLFEFLDDLDLEDEGEEMPPHPKKRAQHSRSKSVSTVTGSDSEDFEVSAPAAKGKINRKGKMPPSVPETPRTQPRRAAKFRSSIVPEPGESEESSEASDGTTPSPPVKRKARTSKEQPASKRKRDEEALDEQIDDLLEGDEGSGAGSGPDESESEESEEGEVDDLLASEDEECL